MMESGDRAVMLSRVGADNSRVSVWGLTDEEEDELFERVELGFPMLEVVSLIQKPYEIWVADVPGEDLILFIAMVLRENGFNIFMSRPK